MEILASFVISVAAGIVTYYICNPKVWITYANGWTKRIATINRNETPRADTLGVSLCVYMELASFALWVHYNICI